MGMFDRFIKTEERTLDNLNAPVSADDFLHTMGWGDFSSSAGVTVNVDNALGVPAIRAVLGMMIACTASTIYNLPRMSDADSIQMAQYLALSSLVGAYFTLGNKFAD